MTSRPVACESWRISDEIWERMVPHLPAERPKPKGGRPRLPDRQAMEAILYLASTGCHWRDIPRELGARSTIHDRFQEWAAAGVFASLSQAGLICSDTLGGLNVLSRGRYMPQVAGIVDERSG
jgi:putative transposase